MKQLSILGSTGSIGTNTLTIVDRFPDRFQVKALAANSKVELLSKQIERFCPELAVVYDENRAKELKELLPSNGGVEIMFGPEGYKAAAEHESVDLVVVAMVGAAGLIPTLAAIESGKNIALANKETLVMAGDIVMRRAADKGVRILPVDSEHNAVFQCLLGHRREDLNKIFLTASGGPFIHMPGNRFKDITPEDALNHPTWQMGKKITIDSATLMNKGLEVMEAKHLFGVSQEMIEVVIHPQSIVHSMVSFRDGAMIAQLGIPDMKGAIAYAISYPERLPLGQPLPALEQIGALTFEKPDFTRFPCLAMAYEACRTGGTMPAVLNAADEVAVSAFLIRLIPFVGIPELIRRTAEKHQVISNPELSDILEADRWAREQTEKTINKICH
ncbi:MAG: 1-deoxy-D-xylulose-5-phosphate reductoisomerase [Deltaproteobacteria bacterium RBG_13_49_15]|nr:MAG: 1-deoxy-D-xylulose-5-phosphate reductoisomerase [Deltaproteobacteria bacterium RBG_13_49_15]